MNHIHLSESSVGHDKFVVMARDFDNFLYGTVVDEELLVWAIRIMTVKIGFNAHTKGIRGGIAILDSLFLLWIERPIERLMICRQEMHPPE